MDFKFTGYKNIRDIGGYRLKGGGVTRCGVFARSDLPKKLTDDERAVLREAGFTTILDLRLPDETVRIKHALDGERGFVYRNISFETWLRDPFYTHEDTATYYHMLLTLKENVKKIIEFLADAPVPVMFNCHAGKDRTGTTAALLHLAAGVEDSEIIADYHKTFGSFWPNKTAEEIGPSRLLPTTEAMEIFLDVFYKKYGSIEGYFDYAGIPQDKLKKIRAKLT